MIISQYPYYLKVFNHPEYFYEGDSILLRNIQTHNQRGREAKHIVYLEDIRFEVASDHPVILMLGQQNPNVPITHKTLRSILLSFFGNKFKPMLDDPKMTPKSIMEWVTNSPKEVAKHMNIELPANKPVPVPVIINNATVPATT